MRYWQTVAAVNRCRFQKNQRGLHLETQALESPIASKIAFDPKKPHFEPRYEGLYSESAEFGARQLAVVTGYCVYEKKKNREIKNPKQIKLKNGRPAIKGTCASCGKQIFRIGKLK
jgi:hypothetical protein